MLKDDVPSSGAALARGVLPTLGVLSVIRPKKVVFCIDCILLAVRDR